MKRRLAAMSCLFLSAALSITSALGAASSHWQHVPERDRDRANPFAGRPAAIAAGARIYSEHCAECHKADALGDGRKKPSLRSQSVRSATDGELEWFLRQGDLGHGMPTWSSLPEAQRWQLVAYLRSLP
jgi:mono/diheme cytochrome c family protein